MGYHFRPKNIGLDGSSLVVCSEHIRPLGFSVFLTFIRYINDICAMVKSCYIGDGHPIFNRNPYNGYINPYYWVDDHPLLYGNNGSLDPGTYGKVALFAKP